MDAIVQNRVSRLIDVRFGDVDELRATVALWDLRFQPIQRRLPGVSGHVAQFASDSAAFGYARFQSAFDQHGAPPEGHITFGVFGVSLQRLWWRGHDVTCDDVVVYRLGDELRSISGPDFEVFTISISEAVFQVIRESLQLAQPTAPQRRKFSLPRALADDLRLRLSALRDDPNNTTAGEARDIVSALVAAWLAPEETAKFARPSLRARDIAIRRSLDFIEAADPDQLSTDVLCRMANASERTLQYAFRERFGLTPAAFIRAFRLSHARRMLLASGPGDATVSQVLFNCGFNHRGRFSADYRRAFGEFPAETLADFG